MSHWVPTGAGFEKMWTPEAVLRRDVNKAKSLLIGAKFFGERTQKRRRAALRKAETALAAFLLSKP